MNTQPPSAEPPTTPLSEDASADPSKTIAPVWAIVQCFGGAGLAMLALVWLCSILPWAQMGELFLRVVLVPLEHPAYFYSVGVGLVLALLCLNGKLDQGSIQLTGRQRAHWRRVISRLTTLCLVILAVSAFMWFVHTLPEP